MEFHRHRLGGCTRFWSRASRGFGDSEALWWGLWQGWRAGCTWSPEAGLPPHPPPRPTHTFCPPSASKPGRTWWRGEREESGLCGNLVSCAQMVSLQAGVPAARWPAGTEAAHQPVVPLTLSAWDVFILSYESVIQRFWGWVPRVKAHLTDSGEGLGAPWCF